MWYTGKPIPTNIITGFLGTGKTTAILDLLQQRPEGERWSVFVNEYGMVSIDDVMLTENSSEVQVQELAGGCFCCTTSALMDTVLMQFIRRSKPDRLLIEPSGAGHPARVIDTLRGDRFRNALDLKATICLVDPKDFQNPRVTNSEGFRDQIQMSDVVAVNWTDKRDPVQINACLQWIRQLDPPKLLVTETKMGQLKSEWLDLTGLVHRLPQFPDAHPLPHHADHPIESLSSAEAEVRIVSLAQPIVGGQPARFENGNGEQRACGWIFSATDVFERDALLDYLGAIHPVQRVKGIFHCTDDWWLINRSRQEVSIVPTAYRRDSRLEIISDESSPHWPEVEERLLSFLVKTA